MTPLPIHPVPNRTVQAEPKPSIHQWHQEFRTGLRADKTDTRFIDWPLRKLGYIKRPINIPSR